MTVNQESEEIKLILLNNTSKTKNFEHTTNIMRRHRKDVTSRIIRSSKYFRNRKNEHIID